MSDYKELIERLKCPDDVLEHRGCRNSRILGFSCAECWRGPMKDAATAIKTLLAERDALLDAVVRGRCNDCVYFETKKCEEPCVRCYHAKQIFEGDRVRVPMYHSPVIDKMELMYGTVEFHHAAFHVKWDQEEYGLHFIGYLEGVEVIGNIHDNPELLEVQE